MMDCDSKTEDGASSEAAFDVSQVCLKVRDLFGLTGETHIVAPPVGPVAPQIE